MKSQIKRTDLRGEVLWLHHRRSPPSLKLHRMLFFFNKHSCLQDVQRWGNESVLGFLRWITRSTKNCGTPQPHSAPPGWTGTPTTSRMLSSLSLRLLFWIPCCRFNIWWKVKPEDWRLLQINAITYGSIVDGSLARYHRGTCFGAI